jgi:hypothetical protein
MKIIDFPKLECVFEKDTIDGIYQVIPKIKEEYRWVFTEDCLAVTKLNGTNTSIVIENGKITKILNRLNVIDLWKSNTWFYEGIRWAIDSKVFIPELMSDGQFWGELIGKKLQGNPYQLESYRWLPFDYLKEKYSFKFWDEIVKDCKDKSDQEIFNIVDDIFKNLWCIYKRQLGIKEEVNENTKFEGLAGEGIVFYNKKTNQMCKLRRDQFKWFSGKRHKETEQ